MKTIAVIPVKHESERVRQKNFRPFDGDRSLLDIKIDQLKKANIFDEIYISSDSPEARKCSVDHGVKFIERDISLCNNVTPWSDVIFEVVSSIPEPGTAHIAWCHTTSPLFNLFNDCLKRYYSNIESGKENGLVAVSACKEFILDERATPVNYSWGPWHRYSQYLKKHYFVSGALFVSTKEEMLKNRYVISSNPYLFEATAEESVDIDTEFDFKFAQYLIDQRKQDN